MTLNRLLHCVILGYSRFNKWQKSWLTTLVRVHRTTGSQVNQSQARAAAEGIQPLFILLHPCLPPQPASIHPAPAARLTQPAQQSCSWLLNIIAQLICMIDTSQKVNSEYWKLQVLIFKVVMIVNSFLSFPQEFIINAGSYKKQYMLPLLVYWLLKSHKLNTAKEQITVRPPREQPQKQNYSISLIILVSVVAQQSDWRGKKWG